MIDILRPINQNYIILESLNQLKDNNNLKSIHVINLNDQKITLGRGHESDVRINDISVSRTHACITFNLTNSRICIRDLKSKFGTLVLLKNNLQVREKKTHLQIGRTYLEVNTISSKDYDKYKKQK
jgi:pSer/pThr/pTyr-binding forkhead associated (FHA) protein